jgi:hypothetical protein
MPNLSPPPHNLFSRSAVAYAPPPNACAIDRSYATALKPIMFLRMRAYNGYSEKDRRRAQAWLNRQWQSGVLARPVQCVACGQNEGIIDAHAENYSEPFAAGKTDQFHLCFTCHMMVHCRFRHPDDWRYYKAVIQSGGRYAPVFSRDIGGFRAKHIGGKCPAPDARGKFRGQFLLDEIEKYGADRGSSEKGETLHAL